MNITTTYPGLSINKLRKKYPQHFWKSQTWYDNEEFADEKAPKGTYHLYVPEESFNKTFEDQKKLAAKGEEPSHPAVLMWGLIDHFEKTGERLLEYRYARTGGRDSDGGLVSVGSFDSYGAGVRRDTPGHADDVLGVCLSRMVVGGVSSEPVSKAEASSRSLEDRVTKLENTLEAMRKALEV